MEVEILDKKRTIVGNGFVLVGEKVKQFIAGKWQKKVKDKSSCSKRFRRLITKSQEIEN